MTITRGRREASAEEIRARQYIASRIKRLINEKGLTQLAVAKGSNVPQNTLSRYMNAKSTPKDEYLCKLAGFFNVDISYFKEEQTETTSTVSNEVLKLDKELHPDSHKEWISFGKKLLDEQKLEEKNQNTVDEPQIIYYTYDYYDQPASAGTGQYLNDVQVEQIELPVKIDADFVIPVYGDSMEPEYHSGDYVFVKLSVDLSSGDIGVFELYGDTYIKELVIDDSGACLHSFNTKKYKDIPIDADSDFRIIGEVVGSYSEK